MMASREVTRAVMATAASSLFVPESLAANATPRFRAGLGEIQPFFERLVAQTFEVSEGVWIGTPFNLNLEKESRELERRMGEITQPHLVLWGEKDGWIPPADLAAMAAAMPDCRLVKIPGVGHSMNVEQPRSMPAISEHGLAGSIAQDLRNGGLAERNSDCRRAFVGPDLRLGPGESREPRGRKGHKRHRRQVTTHPSNRL